MENEIDKAIQVLINANPSDIQKKGYHFQKNDFYSPLNDMAFLRENPDLWHKKDYDPLDIDWNLEGQRKVAREVSEYVLELRDIPETLEGGEIKFCWQNNFFNNTDALVQYGLVRSRKPKKYVEVGCGWSSLLLHRALTKNNNDCKVTLVEPYPNPNLFALFPKEWIHHHSILQRAPMDVFTDLGAGDILFYDGSHCSKVGSDVNYFFFEVLPRLKSGVIIHLHDIFLPNSYPEDWIFNRAQTWNEQFILQAFLMNNDSYRIIMANRYLYERCGQELDALYQGVQPSWGCSFWIEKL